MQEDLSKYSEVKREDLRNTYVVGHSSKVKRKDLRNVSVWLDTALN